MQDKSGKRIMKLDRNTNPDGRGKYALINMRKIKEIEDAGRKPSPHETVECQRAIRVRESIEMLIREGVVTLGNESPGDQFFVMKYKDKFTADGLRGYANAISKELKLMSSGPEAVSLAEYCAQMFDEAFEAGKIGATTPSPLPPTQKAA